jgi:hypothetical protein
VNTIYRFRLRTRNLCQPVESYGILSLSCFSMVLIRVVIEIVVMTCEVFFFFLVLMLDELFSAIVIVFK